MRKVKVSVSNGESGRTCTRDRCSFPKVTAAFSSHPGSLRSRWGARVAGCCLASPWRMASRADPSWAEWWSKVPAPTPPPLLGRSAPREPLLLGDLPPGAAVSLMLEEPCIHHMVSFSSLWGLRPRSQCSLPSPFVTISAFSPPKQ